ncbi:hypothetical protein BT96DRAFT_560392 [Gymnopus androsaceus JB14]|uniref:Uncharacterized protein n=1 Tax=Gymnopus androsaceus JB14 TaxID=1447944 RepID=A0A6A4GKD5_9AGAR|nr:hypothetical protein BT96DRAFT_560392 [Gymnopus androsaceus JB14]
MNRGSGQYVVPTIQRRRVHSVHMIEPHPTCTSIPVEMLKFNLYTVFQSVSSMNKALTTPSGSIVFVAVFHSILAPLPLFLFLFFSLPVSRNPYFPIDDAGIVPHRPKLSARYKVYTFF